MGEGQQPDRQHLDALDENEDNDGQCSKQEYDSEDEKNQVGQKKEKQAQQLS